MSEALAALATRIAAEPPLSQNKASEIEGQLLGIDVLTTEQELAKEDLALALSLFQATDAAADAGLLNRSELREAGRLALHALDKHELCQHG